MDIRLTIRDGLLVRIDKKIKIRRVRTGLYSTTTPLFGGFVIAKRGWVLADATVARPDLPRDHDASRVVQRHVAGRPEHGAHRPRRPRGHEAADRPARRPELTRGRDGDAVARQPARRGIRGCVAAGASGRHRTHVLPRRRPARSRRPVLQPHRLRAACATASRPSPRESSARSPATGSRACGRRTTPASGRACVSPRP